MKISRIETIPVRVPIRKEFQITGALGSHFESPFSILKVHTDEGIVGLGEVSATPVWSGNGGTGRQSVLEEDICFSQTSSLCSPSCLTNIRLEP